MNSGKPTLEFPEMEPETRLWQLILHIAERSQGDPTYGKVKLAKILYFADFSSYRRFGEPITGTSYIKMQYGPVPRVFWDLLEEMEARGDIFVRQEPYYTHDQHRVIAKRDADLTGFTGRDIALVDKIIQDFWGRTATEVSELSHGMAWKVTRLKEPIPYDTAILSDEGITQDDIDSAQELIRDHEWEV